MLNKLYIVCVLLGSVAVTDLYADAVSLNSRPRSRMMGNAGLALSGDKDSAIMNPAGLADFQGTEWQIFPLTIEVPFELNVLSKGLDYYDKRDKDVATAQSALEDFLDEAASSTYKARVNLYPSYTRHNFHVGVMLDGLVDADFRLGGIGSNQVTRAGDTAITGAGFVGLSHSFFKDNLQVGVTLKPIYRVSPFQYEEQRVLDLANGRNQGVDIKDELFGKSPLKRGGFAFGGDIGLKHKFDGKFFGLIKNNATWTSFVERWKPAIGLTWQDVGKTRFLNSGLPEDINQSISVGLALEPSFDFVDFHAALDMRNINEKQNFWNMVHAGLEAVLWDFWSIRGGISSTYLTGGMGLDLPGFEVDIYVSAEEAGEYARLDSVRTVGLRLSAAL